MNKFIFCILILSFSATSFATGELNLSGARSAGVANSSVTFTDVWSVYHNQAGLAYLEKYGFGANYSNEFFVQQLSLSSMALGLPFKFGTFGSCFSHFGYSSYSETRFGLSYGMKLGEKISMGVQMNYLHISLSENYGTRGVVFGEFGIMTKPIENLTIGAHIYNPWRTRIADYNDERLPTVIRLGAGYNFAKRANVTVEAAKDLDFEKIVVKAGIEFNIVSTLHVRVGVSTYPESKFAFGIGYALKGFKADFSFAHHAVLGFTPHFSLSYSFGKKASEKNETI